MKNCKEYIEIFEKLISGNISNEDHSELKKHVESCSECAKLYSTNEMLIQREKPIDHATENDFNNLRFKVTENIRKQHENSFSAKTQKMIEAIIIYLKKPEYALAAITRTAQFISVL